MFSRNYDGRLEVREGQRLDVMFANPEGRLYRLGRNDFGVYTGKFLYTSPASFLFLFGIVVVCSEMGSVLRKVSI